MLFELRDYLKARQRASLQQIAQHLRQSPEVTRGCLQHWVRKGKICRAEPPVNCGTKCRLCQPEVAEVYCWSENY